VSDPFISQWDTGGAAALWDNGLEWDVTVGPAIGDVTPWLNLVTSEHADKPKFMAMLAGLLQPLADIVAVAASLPGLYDLDTAAGIQLDVIGLWVGISRNIAVPISGVYLTLGNASLGLGVGRLRGPNDPLTGLVSLPDDAFRTVIRGKIAQNHWDGTIPGIYSIWNTLFGSTGIGIKVTDNLNMSITYSLTGTPPDATTLGLFRGGYLTPKPAGVAVSFT
jgi:hypothetical protein